MSNNAHLEITTNIGCFLNCDFCPQDKLIKAYGNNQKKMYYIDFVKYLAKVPREVDIHFSGFCEPFLNLHCIDMIEFALTKGHKVSLFTTLMGATFQDYKRLLNYHFDKVCIHIPDNEGRSKFKITDEYIEFLDYVLNTKVSCNKFWINCHGTIHDRIKHLINEPIDNYIIDRAGNVEIDGISKTYIFGMFTCGAVGHKLNQNVLLPNGDVVLCCMDYELKHKLGNLNNCTYEELFTSKEANKIRNVFDGKLNKEILCENCNRAIKI